MIFLMQKISKDMFVLQINAGGLELIKRENPQSKIKLVKKKSLHKILHS